MKKNLNLQNTYSSKETKKNELEDIAAADSVQNVNPYAAGG